MIELILGIIVLVAALGLGFFVVAAGAMSDSQNATEIITPYLWTIVGGWAVVEIVLFFVWYAKHKGWS